MQASQTRTRPPAATAASPSKAPASLQAGIREMSSSVSLLLDEVGRVIVGKRDVVEMVVVASLTEGAHILFEDVPGLAKSVMASTFAKAAGCEFHRIQFTPDLLPTDITGGHVYNRKENQFEFRRGPIFTNFLLADEINRASPKTQSALLEAMAEKQVSVEGVTHPLSAPFMVLATQNPVEQEGTYPLPEAQLDRFALRLSVGYPSKDEEAEIMARRIKRKHDAFDTRPAFDRERMLRMQRTIEDVYVDPSIVDYIARVVDATRHHPGLAAGASPRGSLALVKLARAYAAIKGRTYVIPDDVRRFAVVCLAHRMILKTEERVRGGSTKQIIEDILRRTPVPRTANGT